MTKQTTNESERAELLSQLAQYGEEDLRMALRAANAQKQTREEGLYFLHYFFGEDRVGVDESGHPVTLPMDADGAMEPTGKVATISIPIDETIMNPGQMVHGGVTALLCDNVMGMASFMSAGRPGVTLEMTVRYHMPGRGNQLIGQGEVVHAGGQINSTRCEVRDDQGNLVATATGSFYHSRKRS